MFNIGSIIALIGAVLGLIGAALRGVLNFANIGPGAGVPDTAPLPFIGMFEMNVVLMNLIGVVVGIILVVVGLRLRASKEMRPALIMLILGFLAIPLSVPFGLAAIGGLIALIGRNRA